MSVWKWGVNDTFENIQAVTHVYGRPLPSWRTETAAALRSRSSGCSRAIDLSLDDADRLLVFARVDSFRRAMHSPLDGG